MFEIAGGILLAVLVLVFWRFILIAALWCAAVLAVIGAIAAGIMVPEIGIIELILAVIIGIFIYCETRPTLTGDEKIKSDEGKRQIALALVTAFAVVLAACVVDIIFADGTKGFSFSLIPFVLLGLLFFWPKKRAGQ